MAEADWENPEPFQYMMDVDNGMVHGLEYNPETGEYKTNDLKTEDKSPSTILNATTNHEYDFEYTDPVNEATDVDRVGFNSVNGVIDLYNGEELVDRYSLVAVLNNENERPELVFGGLEHDENEVISKTSEEIEWSPELATAYEAVYNFIGDKDPRDIEEESVSLYEEDTVTTLNQPEARQTVKRIDDFIKNLQNDPATGIADFEENGEITIGFHDHYGSARNYDAARNVKTDLNRLENAGLLEYSTENLNDNGDEKEVDLKIEKEFLDGKGSLRDDVAGLSDFEVDTHDGREELTEERMS